MTGKRQGGTLSSRAGMRSPRWPTAVVLAGLLLTACGGSGGASAPASPTAAAAAPTTAAATSTPLAPLKVRILVVVRDRCCLNYLPALIGARLGVFREAGLDVDWREDVTGSAPTTTAVLTGVTDVAVINGSGPVAAAGSGRPIKIFSAENLQFWPGMVIRPQLAAELAAKGVTPASSWQDKMRALKGKRIWTASVGGIAELRQRRISVAVGIDPDKDITMQGGDPTAGNAAWRSGQVDTFTCCEPEPFLLVPDAVTWTRPGEITLPIKGYSTIFVTTEQFARQNPEVLKRIIAAQKKMKAMILAATPGSKERDAILKALQAQYPTVPAELIAKSFDTGRTTFDIDNDLTRALVQDTIDDFNEAASPKITLKPEDFAAAGFMK